MYSISATNYVILTALLCGALFMFFKGLRQRWTLLARGKPWFGPVVSREAVVAKLNWRTFLARGVLLSRLIKRPASGIAHLLLFFGAIVEIAGHGLFPLSWLNVDVYGGWFGHFVMEGGREVAGIAMLLGILFLTIRRLIPPERLTVHKIRRGFLSMELLLLLIVIAGFVAEAFRLTDPAARSQGEFLGRAMASMIHGLGAQALVSGNQAMWWLHGLMGVAFIALVTRTPMSHMVLGPINSALANRRPGINLSPIDFEAEDDSGKDPVFGATRIADLSQKHLIDLSSCLWCGRCHEACPAAQTGKPLSPKNVMTTCAEYLEQGKIEDAGLIDELGQDAIFNCTTCGACVEQCPVSNSPAEVILEFRRNFVMDRSEMPDTMAAANRNLESRGHPFVGTGANPEDWRKDIEVPLFTPGQTEYLLWIGCSVTYEERAQQIARAMVRILEAAGVSYGVLEESRCTGDPAKMMGNEMQFQEIAMGNIEEFQEMKVQKVITMCAHCFNTFDRYYPELGANWETIPHSVLIDRLIQSGRLKVARNEAEKITFHDPCYLARHNDIVDETRSVVSAVGRLIEMPRNRKDGFCCGAGGGNYWGGQGGTARISDVRTEEALATGADKIATSCSFCLLMLTSSASKHTEERKVFDIAELVVSALPSEQQSGA
jgi:Fe-S oxidoreductase/nitrate reductase gamma subunit